MIIPDAKKTGPDFAQSVPPTNPWVGCVWLDTSNNTLKVFNGFEWDIIQEQVWLYVDDHGYVCGGRDDSAVIFFSVIDRFQFPFDNGTAAHVGNLAVNNECYGGCNSTQYGYTAGAQTDDTVYTSYIHRIQFPFDSGTALICGYQTKNVNDPSCNGSSQHGYVCGGREGDDFDFISTIDRFQFPFDSGTASHVGNLSLAKFGLGANNSSQHSYVCGGRNDLIFSTVDRFQFPFDSGIASHVGNLSRDNSALAANNSSQHGYVCGGWDITDHFSNIDRFQFPFDSGTASHVGNLSGNKRFVAANNSSRYGYVCGGGEDTNRLSTIDRFQFPFDSGTASHVGDISIGRQELGGIDATDFVQMFV